MIASRLQREPALASPPSKGKVIAIAALHRPATLSNGRRQTPIPARSRCEPTMFKSLLPVFLTVFLAELGDKTQLATLLFAAEGKIGPWGVFAASATALVACAAIGVIAGTAAAQYLDSVPLKLIAGAGFVAIGAWTIYGHYSG